MRDDLATLDDAAFGAASAVKPKFVSPSDPAAQWTGALRGPAFFAYVDNYLIDTENAIVVDVEGSRAIRQAEVGAARTMIDRVAARFGLRPRGCVGIPPMPRPPCWLGSSRSAASRRTFRSSTSPGGMVGRWRG